MGAGGYPHSHPHLMFTLSKDVITRGCPEEASSREGVFADKAKFKHPLYPGAPGHLGMPQSKASVNSRCDPKC